MLICLHQTTPPCGTNQYYSISNQIPLFERWNPIFMDTLTHWISWQLHHRKRNRNTHRDDLGGSVKKYTMHIVCRNCISHKLSLKVQMRQSSVVFFQDLLSCTLYLWLAVLFSHLPQHNSLLHPAKPIRDLRASLPINYHPNQCRGLWYRIICQISADGWGQVPLCHRPYPHGNLCSGWALLMLPNLLVGSHCVLQDCRPPAWSPRLLIYKHLSLTSG